MSVMGGGGEKGATVVAITEQMYLQAESKGRQIGILSPGLFISVLLQEGVVYSGTWSQPLSHFRK